MEDVGRGDSVYVYGVEGTVVKFISWNNRNHRKCRRQQSMH